MTVPGHTSYMPEWGELKLETYSRKPWIVLRTDIWRTGARTIKGQEPEMSNKQTLVGHVRFALPISLSVLKTVIEKTKLKCFNAQESEV